MKPDAPDEEVDQCRGAVANPADRCRRHGRQNRQVGQAPGWRPGGQVREGAYVLFQFTAGPESVKELERRLRVSDIS